MNQRPFDFFDEVLRRYFGSTAVLCPQMRRDDVEKLLSDDAEWRLLHGRRAAIDWGHREGVDVDITSERLLVTDHGLLYAARLSAPARTSSPGAIFAGPARRPMYYLATPRALFEPIVDRARVTPLRPGSAAAVDDRLGRDLLFSWPLDGGLRRILGEEPILRMESVGR